MSKAILIVILFISLSIFLYILNPLNPLDPLLHPLEYKPVLLEKLGIK